MRSSSPTPADHSLTPHPQKRHYPSLSISTHLPLQSSPLASLSPGSSPTRTTQRRRKSGYKAAFPLLLNPIADVGSVEEPQKAFLRERFKARCFERARKDREKARRRVSRASAGSISGGSSDGDGDLGMDDDGNDAEEEDENTVMQDELFRRIMANASRKRSHTYRLSYAYEVGSSIDPDMEDVGQWEAELREQEHIYSNTTPQDLEDEELRAYAEEHAALADFEDFEWNLSDLDDVDAPNADSPLSATAAEDEMDIS